MITVKERGIVRELAKKYAELAVLDVNKERRERGKNTNDLIPVRPMVWIDEIPWHEMDIDGQLVLRCENDLAREMEQFFRRNLFRWKYFQADMVLTPYYPISKNYTNSGIGVSVHEDILATDKRNNIVSHSYDDMLDTEEKLSRVHIPVITAHPEIDTAKKAQVQEVLEGIMPVRLMGHYASYVPWDELSMLRGVEPILYDLIDEPAFMHETIKKFTQIGISKLTQMADQGLFESEPIELHCTPPYVSDLPRRNDEKGSPLKEVWFRGTAQMFATVSPEMFDEYEIQYIKPIAEMCGLTYYGCCEPLDNFIPVIKQIKNLRKLGVSPWANPEKCAEQIGGDYVFARKPNPALVSGTADAEVIRKETLRSLKAIQRYNCPAEFVLKDISTVSGKPENLILWNKVVQETIDEFY